MYYIFDYLLLVGLFFLIVGLIRPSLTSFLLGKYASRKKVLLVFGLVIVICISLVGFTIKASERVSYFSGIVDLFILLALFFGLFFGSYILIKFLFSKRKGFSSYTKTLLTKQTKPDWLTTCPTCKTQSDFAYQVRKHLWGLIQSKTYTCRHCNAVFEERNSNFKLSATTIAVKSLTWDEYKGETLTISEWEKIAHGGMSDAKQAEAEKQIAAEKAALEEKNRVEKILSGNIEPIHTDFHLQKGEHAYFQFDTSRYADVDYIKSHTVGKSKKKGSITRAVVGGVLFGGVGAIVGASGAGSEIKETTTQEKVTRTEEVDIGEMIFTNKRLLFVGKEVTSIFYKDIIDIQFYGSRLHIRYPSMLKAECYSAPDMQEAENYYKGMLQLGKSKS